MYLNMAIGRSQAPSWVTLSPCGLAIIGLGFINYMLQLLNLSNRMKTTPHLNLKNIS